MKNEDKTKEQFINELVELRQRIAELGTLEAERKREEDALRGREELYRSVFENKGTATGVFGDNGIITMCNTKFEELSGYSKDEVEDHMKWSDFVTEKHLERMKRYHAQRSTHRGNPPSEYECEIIHKNGDIKCVTVNIDLIPATRQRVVSLTDITERKQAEEALRKSEERYALTTKAGQVGVWDWNLETNEIYVDPNLKAMLSYADHEIRNHLDDWGELVHPDDSERVMAQADAHLEGLTPQYEIAHRMLHKDGSIRWFLARGTAMRTARGKPYRVVGTDTDITERVQAEEERQTLQKRLEEALTKILGGFINICAQCKKIRDKKGNWVQIERYIGSHTEVQFTHGLCPECLKEFRADYEGRERK